MSSSSAPSAMKRLPKISPAGVTVAKKSLWNATPHQSHSAASTSTEARPHHHERRTFARYAANAAKRPAAFNAICAGHTISL